MIFDRWGNPLGDLPYAIKAIRTRATDGTDTLDVTTIGEINKDERIVFKDSMGRWAEYVCQSTQTARAAGMPVTVAYCAGGIAELSRTYIEDKRNRNANAKACLAKALEGTRWTVGTVETGTITGTADLAFYHCTVLEAVQKTADTYGLEVQTEYQPDPTGNRIGQRIIHLVEHRGSTNTTKRFEYGKDLTQIKRDIDAGDVITRLYGWGKGIEQTNEEGEATGGYGRKISFADVNNGKPYIQDDQALANWGIVGADGTKHHSEASVDFPDCEDPKELLNLTKAALKTRTTPTVSYTADVTALGQAGYDPEGTDVGDSVQIIDTSFTTPLRLEGRILQIEEDLAGSLADTKITLGNIRQTYTQRMAAQQQALDKLVSNSGAWNSAAGGTGPYMKDLIDRINQIMNATGGYTYLKPGQGIYVYDKPEDQNPTQCIHIGGGYWRIADHKKPNGDWDFRALANGKGIFADTVFTGRLSDAAGLNYWDMDTGEFSLSANSTINGNKASSLATQTQAQKLATDAQTAAKAYADRVGASTLSSAKSDATAKADTALSGAKTYAEAIMAYGSNLVRNPNGNPDHDLDKLGASKLTKTMPATHPEGITSAIHLGNVRDTYFGWLLDTFRGHTFRLSGWAYRKAGNVTSSFGIYWIGTDGTNHWQAIAQSAANASGWTYVSGSYTVPSNAKTARLWMQVDRNTAAASDADWYWTGLQCTDETAARSYVDTFEGELTQTYIFNKLTNNGQKQGLYLSNGLLYINATYMKTGVITGKRSYWNLDTGQFVMTDANGNETVHLDGDGVNNLLTGTFRTARTGNRVQISPSFKQTEISGTDSLEGAGIQFYHGSGSYQHPYIAVESTTQQEGEVSALTFNGGRRAEHDPGAFARIGERKADDNTTKVGTVFLAAEKDYDSTDPSSRRAYLSLWSPKTGATTATLAARDPNGLVGIQADIDSGYLYMSGFLGGFSGGRSTFQAVWWEGQNIGAMKYAQYTFTSSNPAKYGSYKAFATVDHRQDDPGLFVTTVSDCTASGWSIWVYTPPEKVVTAVDSHWNYNTSTGVVSNLSINTHYAALFQGNKPYQLHTIGFLKK
ncbi:phage tail spike protein [Bifidobacterium pseudocatenulatum]|uniref:phage tail spike protein n=1 Tax=Bifidobacterium pseudocatenulatum TaxID=28026 RepID=UPI00232B93AB|nr:phage tail spike protein [Bifidobacterium pseudocatenulatum]MDB6493753.1 phage tail protein [Bifidobacterium pseudocatenulatum]MDB6504868.1 phage tail protein [Bifidobacterium pseudocatenulatum]